MNKPADVSTGKGDNPTDKPVDSAGEIEGIGVVRDDYTNTMIEFGKKSIIDSVTVIKEFMKMMIPLTTGLITAYFALLKFLGVETVPDANKVSPNELIGPTIFMFISLVAFIVTSFPLLSKHLDFGKPESIKIFRKKTVKWKYVGAIIGMGFFLYGVIWMILVIEEVLEGIKT